MKPDIKATASLLIVDIICDFQRSKKYAEVIVLLRRWTHIFDDSFLERLYVVSVFGESQ